MCTSFQKLCIVWSEYMNSGKATQYIKCCTAGQYTNSGTAVRYKQNGMLVSCNKFGFNEFLTF